MLYKGIRSVCVSLDTECPADTSPRRGVCSLDSTEYTG